jgi:hypothetical protein
MALAYCQCCSAAVVMVSIKEARFFIRCIAQHHLRMDQEGRGSLRAKSQRPYAGLQTVAGSTGRDQQTGFGAARSASISEDPVRYKVAV